MSTAPSQTTDDASSNLLDGYVEQVAAGARHNDEMVGPDGNLKPVWAPFFEHLSSLSPKDLSRRFARGDQYLRDAGVLYRQYDESMSTERKWPLSHIPVIIEEPEWQKISAGLIERANLLEGVLRDFYGANTLVSSGQLPATILSQNPAWLRPMVGTIREDESVLNSLSFELGRGPDGKWWVISDIVEAPSTTGFAIENRIAMGRVFPNFFNGANIHRLAGFFQKFQKTLLEMKGQADGEIALLSPGPLNQSYAEHAYIARYLGLLLVEGEDLIVQNGQAMVRTVAGNKPISLLWNRLPSKMFDPLELDPTSMIGTAGLVQAVRDGELKTVNMVGAGVLETRALMAFLPKIARAQLGRGLSLPNIATWWCGQDSQRSEVLANRDRMMVGDAFSTTPLMADITTMSLGSDPRSPQAAELAEILQKNGPNLVGQEAVTLSTTPSFEDGRLVARPMCLRISLGRTADGWAVMPGGYARISGGSDAKALTMQQGGKVADVWITSKSKVETPSLLTESDAAYSHNSTQSILPSRAADNLFWVGRYVERAEQNMRLFRAYFARISDGAKHDDALPKFMRAALMDKVAPEAHAMAQNFAKPLEFALQSAARISDRVSPDGLMALRALVTQLDDLDLHTIAPDDIPIEISALLRQVTGFSGLVHENMYRSDGWRFLSLGVSLERAANMCGILAAGIDEKAPLGMFDLALDVGDSVVSHRAQFMSQASTASVLGLLAFDPQNPRSIRYHLSRARQHISRLPRQDSGHELSDVAREVLRAEAHLMTSEAAQVTPAFLIQLRQDIWKISTALNKAYFV